MKDFDRGLATGIVVSLIMFLVIIELKVWV